MVVPRKEASSFARISSRPEIRHKSGFLKCYPLSNELLSSSLIGLTSGIWFWSCPVTMSEMALGAARSGNGEGPPVVATPPYITDCVYQLVQITGPDGKKVLKLFPVSEPLNNLKPLVQSPVVSHAVKGNVSLSFHDYVKTSFTSTITSPAAKISELKTVTSRYLVLPKPLNQLEQVDVTSVVKQNPIPSTVFGIKSSYSADRSSQKAVAPVCSDTSTAIVKIENTPLSVKPPMLPIGHLLQIPANAKIKSLPASVLPPVIQEKILTTTVASNTSGPAEVTNAPIVTFVSLVNKVKTSATESLEMKYPKPTEAVSSSLILATTQKVVDNSAVEVSTSGSMENRTTPIKWVVHENPQSSSSYLAAAKSSNNVASTLLKTLTNMKNTESNSTGILPICSSSFCESHAKIPSIKDNALVMCNGKVYLLAKKESNILSTLKPGKQESTNVRKQPSVLINSVTDSAIANRVINFVLSKNKRVASNVKEPKFSDNMIPYLESEVNKDFKAKSIPVSSHDNLQISSISQHKAVSSGASFSVGINVAQKYFTKENTDITQKDLSSKAAADPTSPPVVHHAVKEKEQVEITSEMPIWMKHIQEQQKKQYLQLRKKFGLFKEERIYLRRVSSVLSKSSEVSVFFNSVQMNDIDNLMSMPMKSESEKEETIIGEQGEKNIKRKTKVIAVLENPKKRRNDATRVRNSDFECNKSYSVMENLNNSCIQDLSKQEHSSSFLQCSYKVTTPGVHNNEENSVLNSSLFCHENETALSEGSFEKNIFHFTHPDLEETIKDEKITRLKLLLKEQEAALEAIRKKMHQS